MCVISDVGRSGALDPKHAAAHSELGKLLADQFQDYDSAEQLLRRSIELDPRSGARSQTYVHLGSLLEVKRRDTIGAEQMYRKALELIPRVAKLHFILGTVMEKNGNIPGAIKAVEEYIRLGNPDNDGEQRLATLRAKLK